MATNLTDEPKFEFMDDFNIEDLFPEEEDQLTDEPECDITIGLLTAILANEDEYPVSNNGEIDPNVRQYILADRGREDGIIRIIVETDGELYTRLTQKEVE